MNLVTTVVDYCIFMHVFVKQYKIIVSEMEYVCYVCSVKTKQNICLLFRLYYYLHTRWPLLRFTHTLCLIVVITDPL